MNQTHVHQQIPDYVLGLLPGPERRQVEQHTRHCDGCRRALRQEMRLGQTVRATLQTATQPPAHLRRLMPAAPQPRVPLFTRLWARQFAPVAIILFLLLGGLGLHLSGRSTSGITPSTTALAATATMTNSPTAAITETRSETIEPVQTAVPVSHQPAAAPLAPSPNPTPVAAIPPQIVSN